MGQSGMDTILKAQARLMSEYQITSETALGLLVWAAEGRHETVSRAAADICDAMDGARHLPGTDSFLASA